MSRSENSAKLEMRVLRFMQLPFVIAVLINFLLVLRVPFAQLWAYAAPDVVTQDSADPSEVSVTPDEVPVSYQQNVNPPQDVHSSGRAGKIMEDNPARTGGTDATPAGGIHDSPLPVQRTVEFHRAGQSQRNPANLAAKLARSSEQPSVTRTQGAQLLLIYPVSGGADIHYVVDHKDRVLRSGQSDHLSGQDSWTIQFHRGGEFGDARYVLTAGTYEFTAGPRGWELTAVQANAPVQR